MNQRSPGVVLIVRPRGRPPAREPRGSLSAWLPTRLIDQIARIAARNDLTISKTVEKILTARLSRD